MGSEIVFNQNMAYQKSQIENLQASLAAVTGQLLTMQETLAEKETEINDLQVKLAETPSKDHTLTLVQALINLYKFILPKEVE